MKTLSVAVSPVSLKRDAGSAGVSPALSAKREKTQRPERGGGRDVRVPEQSVAPFPLTQSLTKANHAE